MRIGIGYDSHRFDRRRGPLRLGGVEIAHTRRLLGHSDADVLLHAITDALLGAVGAPDLGELFPPSDARYRHADSARFVREAYARVKRAGWRVGNIDATVVADAPTLTPHKPRMRQAVSRLLGIRTSAVSIKAKTTEGLSPGARGIAAYAVVLLRRQTARSSARTTRARVASHSNARGTGALRGSSTQ